ncbi:unnamed protein product [Gemmata massiliana]|uniref:Uncharacterized protein n=1 Tax=Gemmata massiliana TaxID=1210884 RepID=A0A6P2CZ22_9BACT|nr:hypothetical protein [Gemmata massiliana]VTR92460.1 unnamed protein product [Gemmata massiliana]
MPSTRDPSALTPEERTAELATGLARLGSALLAPPVDPTQTSEKSSESAANGLTAGPQKSVTGTAG